ncbi:NADAR family protein [Phaeodactylibacter luteus]|uniref:NADAR family protein n=1 Tax=Phaeodactylibacter luteus TaxID=1564516 RepID=A0A5C6RUV6_9BACT|nr:NADAR family protein [Phaeodactylibacter luteus]TXB66296.1 NADAR family protein [Phaeodactylibacter luteus]
MITTFKGQYAWLSNFKRCEVFFRGAAYTSSEHAYMSAKSECPDWKAFCQDGGNSPGRVKAMSRRIAVRPDWNEVKVGVMREVLRDKFSREPFRSYLLDTGNCHLEEGNRWGDQFWGVDLKTGEGQNHLGRLLMEVRDELYLAGQPRLLVPILRWLRAAQRRYFPY